MDTKQSELTAAEKLLSTHVRRFDELLKHRELREKDWRPYRFAVRDAVIGIVVERYQPKESVLEVDICITEDPEAFEGYSGTKLVMLFLLSEAYKCGSSMGIRFTTDFGDKRTRVYPKIYDLALDYAVQFKHAAEGFITPKEARMLYLALTPFSKEAREKVMELSLANLVAPERICYLVHHGVWTIEDMEMILLGSEYPERILLVDVTPREYLLFYDVVSRTRLAILGEFLDRKLRLKELTDEIGNVYDLEGNDRSLTIHFDPRFYAKVYETHEETPISWTKYRDWTVPAGSRIVAMVRAYDWPDLVNHFNRDLETMRELIRTYDDGSTHFFYFVPRDVFSLPEDENLEDYEKALKQIGAMLMVCPELLVRLDEDALNRLDMMSHIRHDVATGVAAERVFMPSQNPSRHNSTQITFVAVDPAMREGVIELPKLVAQALHDERELATGVNRRNVIQRHHRVMDRMHFLAQIALMHPEVPRLTLSDSHLSGLADLYANNPEGMQATWLLSGFIPHDELYQYIAFIDLYIKGNDEMWHMLDHLHAFLENAAKQGLTVLIVQDKHAEPIVPVPIVIRDIDQVERAFAGQFVPDWVIDFSGKNIYEVATQMVWNAVNAAKRGQGHGLNLSDYPHMIIGETFHTFVYKKQPQDAEHPVSVNIVYTDGSTARPFPLFRLRKRSKEELRDLRDHTIMLNIGSQSCRHGEMDDKVDLYWFLNIEVNHAGETSAEKDEWCYQETLRKLAMLPERNQRIRIAFYQTGFEPSLIGFYRAVTQSLMDHSGESPFIEIVPMIWNNRTKNYEAGSSWA